MDTLIENVDLLVDAAIEIILALALGLVDALPKLRKGAEDHRADCPTLIETYRNLAAAGKS